VDNKAAVLKPAVLDAAAIAALRDADEKIYALHGVKVMLAQMGLNGDVIRATGRGERELRDQTPDETTSALNRRVEVYVK